MMQRSVTVLASAFFLLVAFQTFQSLHDHSNLATALAGQQAPLEQAIQITEEAQALAGDTAALADKGNANAKQAVDIMRQQGIALRAPPATAPTPTP